LKRKLIDSLIQWKTEDNGKPILLTGAKGVGKTYLAYDFAKAFFERICYLNFENNYQVLELLNSQDTATLKDKFMTYFQLNPMDEINQRILILDEISFNTEAIIHLINQELSGIFRYIICISSYPLSQDITLAMKSLCVYPLEFDEFLRATSNEWYIETIQNHYLTCQKIPEIVHKELLALHQLYLIIGGMPGVINEYLNLSTTINVSEQHRFLLGSYRDHIQRDYADSDSLKMLQVYDSIIPQLQKDNKKFQYKLIRKGTTHAMYKEAIAKLCDNSYVVKCNRITTDQIREKSFPADDWSNSHSVANFKLYLPDTGLLNTRRNEEGNRANQKSIYDKVLLENYLAGSLQTKHYPFVFWESESMAKVDFIYQKDNQIYPVEIFDSENTRSKSISVLKQCCEFPYAIRISSRNFEYSNQIKYVPYYAVFCL
jgi:predicted AAA+ superfamily ATPase